MVKGIGGMLQAKGEGTSICKLEDDYRVIHPINIKKELYITKAPSFLLSPQQRAQ